MPILTSQRNAVSGKMDLGQSYELKIINDYPWFTPTIVLAAYARLEKKVGERNLGKGKYKQVREMRAVALFLLGIMQAHQKEYWLQPVLNERTPDVRTFCFDRDSDGTVEQVLQEVEVVTYNSFAQEELIDFVKAKKLTNRSYPSYYVILCELRKNFILPSPKNLQERLKKIAPKQNIAFIGKINPDTQIYKALKVYPQIDLFENFNAIQLAQEQDNVIKSEGRHHSMFLKYQPKAKELNLKSSSKIHHPFANILEKEFCI